MPRYDVAHREKIKQTQLGAKNSNWKGGTSPEYYKLKGSASWRNMRERVFKRDKGICAVCREKKVKWHIHHLVHWDRAKQHIFDDTIVITLCPKCHHRIHRLGLRVGEYEKAVNSKKTYVHPRWGTEHRKKDEYGNFEPSQREDNTEISLEGAETIPDAVSGYNGN